MNRKLLNLIRLGSLAAVLLLAPLGQAQVTLLSSNPADGATGVSVSSPVVFTFSGAMNGTFLVAPTFYSTSPAGSYPVNSVWSSGNTVLTCTPMSSFAPNATISWQFYAYDAGNNPILGLGSFTTGAGGSSSGSGTNATTTFGLSKVYLWNQSIASGLTNIGWLFNASTILASNRTATNITLTMPTAVITNLNPISSHTESNYFSAYFYPPAASSNSLETPFPQGTYTFNVQATASNQTVQVVLPMSMGQPNPPFITNLAAAQSINATQSFVLGWQAFAGGTVTDYVNVSITDTNDGVTLWKTPDPGTLGALDGTVTGVTIPANTLKAGSNYLGYVGFYHAVGVSNANYLTLASRVAGTQFPLGTAGASAPLPVVTNYVKSGSTSSFDVLTTTGQGLTVVSSTNGALQLSQWPILLFTNSPGTSVHITDPRPATNRVMLYRVRNGT